LELLCRIQDAVGCTVLRAHLNQSVLEEVTCGPNGLNSRIVYMVRCPGGLQNLTVTFFFFKVDTVNMPIHSMFGHRRLRLICAQKMDLFPKNRQFYSGRIFNFEIWNPPPNFQKLHPPMWTSQISKSVDPQKVFTGIRKLRTPNSKFKKPLSRLSLFVIHTIDEKYAYNKASCVDNNSNLHLQYWCLPS
jgi:hypothetical protein